MPMEGSHSNPCLLNGRRYEVSWRLPLQPAPAVAPKQQYKFTIEQHAGFQLAVFQPRLYELLIIPVADGNDESPSLSKLACKYPGDFRSPGGNEDRVVGRGVEEARGPVPVVNVDIRIAQIGQPFLRGKRQRSVVFHGDDLAYQEREHRRLVTRARSNFQY